MPSPTLHPALDELVARVRQRLLLLGRDRLIGLQRHRDGQAGVRRRDRRHRDLGTRPVGGPGADEYDGGAAAHLATAAEDDHVRDDPAGQAQAVER